ncbi:MAG: hypothetical protein D6738_01560 [Acidobacteria bacterium]|nr:MAG: hypothetical protein D6738_01560 [Acidobacteriota bacterium]
MTRVTHVTLAMAALLAAAGCGSDYAPPADVTTGVPAGALDRVYDVDVDLPHVVFDGGRRVGVRLDLVLRVDTFGPGRHVARVAHRGARVAGEPEPVTSLGAGTTTLIDAGGLFETGRIGPVQVAGVSFEYVLRGTQSPGGWQASGEALESQTALGGRFDAWRRRRLLVASTDFSPAGSVDRVSFERDAAVAVETDLARASADPFLRATGGAVFLVNRLSFDNVARLDPERGFAIAWQAGVGAGANPHDVLLVGPDRAFVTRYEPPFDDVLVIDPRGGGARGTIDLAPLAENPDGTPRPDRMRAAAGLVFVGLQDIDRTFTRWADGKLAAIDPATEQVVGVVRLPGRNPGTIERLVEPDGRERLYVALGGIFPGLLPQELSGGVAVVDPANLAFERWALDDDDAGGNVGALALARPDLGYVVVSDAAFRNRVLAFDPRDGTVLRTVWETADFVPELEVLGGGLLAIPDRSFAAPRVCLYRIPPPGATTAETAAGCGALRRGPFSLEALD